MSNDPILITYFGGTETVQLEERQRGLAVCDTLRVALALMWAIEYQPAGVPRALYSPTPLLATIVAVPLPGVATLPVGARKNSD